MILCLITDYYNLFLQKVGTGETVSFSFSDEYELLTRFAYVFMFFYFACNDQECGREFIEEHATKVDDQTQRSFFQVVFENKLLEVPARLY